jgi:hypothetical protein
MRLLNETARVHRALWARVLHGRSLRWRSNRGGPITSVWYLQYRVKQLRLRRL